VAERDRIIEFLDEFLDVDGFDDYGPNGLQVPGAAEVELVVTGVSAQRELFTRAAEAGAQLVITHHGLFWDFHPRTVSPAMRRRLEILFESDISLAGYHLPLDAHPEVGNNALICDALGLERGESFGEHQGRKIGFVGRSPEGLAFTELRERCERVFGRPPFIWDGGPESVHTVGVLSGGAASTLAEAITSGLDAFLTGEPAEHVMADALENHVHFIAAGHYATETFGVRRLGELVAERFGISHRFVDVPNPI
jgi:dinuclear metal center YbgI/SA1388 family protein